MSRYVAYPDELNSFRPLFKELVQELEEGFAGQAYAFIALDDLVQKSLRVAHTENSLVQRDRGVVMRLMVNECNFERATNLLDELSLRRAAKELKELVQKRIQGGVLQAGYSPRSWCEENVEELHPLMKAQLPTQLAADTVVHFGTPYQLSPEKTDIDWMVEQARSWKAAIEQESAGFLTTVGVILRQKIKTRLFVDREKNMSQAVLTSLGYVYGLTAKGRMSRVIHGGMAGFEAAEMSAEDLREVVHLAKKLDQAEYLKPGRYRLITGPDVTGVIAHEAFGHTQEGDTCRMGRSCAPELKKKGVAVGNEMASIVNNAAVFEMDGHAYGPNGSHFFDDEGQLARPHVILERGYLQTPMNDLLSSVKGDVNGPAPRQSNGKRESWRNPIMSRQTNTYFTAGDKTLEDMIAMVQNGFLAMNAHGGMEDPKGMGLTAGTEYLEEIKEGRLTGRIFLGPQGGHVELSDPVPHLLNGILAKSKTEQGAIPLNKWGGCGKYHKELVEAGSGGPYILWDSVNCG